VFVLGAVQDAMRTPASLDATIGRIPTHVSPIAQNRVRSRRVDVDSIEVDLKLAQALAHTARQSANLGSEACATHLDEALSSLENYAAGRRRGGVV